MVFAHDAPDTCVFKLDTNGNHYAVLHTFHAAVDGRFAYGKLAQGSDGALYGAAQSSGANSADTVFKLNPDGSSFQVLHTFGSRADGKKPYGGVILGDDGALYGTTVQGGLNNLGIVFKLSHRQPGGWSAGGYLAGLGAQLRAADDHQSE